MFFSFGNKSGRGETILILDIGSGSVAGSFVNFSHAQNPRILYTNRVPIKIVEELKGERFKQEMFNALNILLLDLNKVGLSYLDKSSKNSIAKIYFSHASPWFISQTKTIRIEKTSPFLVTKEFLSDILQKEEEEFEKANISADDRVDKNNSPQVIERKLINVKLNGYKTQNPFGKKATIIELSLFLSLAESSVLQKIEELASKHFHIKEFIFHSFTLISFSAVRDMYERVSNFLLLDITGEVTDVSLIKSGSILKTMSFPLGRNSLIRQISEALKISGEESNSLMRLFLKDSLNKSQSKVLSGVINDSKMLWSGEFQKSLAELSNASSVPTTIFFTADDDVASLYSEAIRSEEFVQHSITEGLFVVSIINWSALDSHISFRVKEDRDIFIGIESLFFNKLFELKK